MLIPTEPIGSIPRPPELLAAMLKLDPSGALLNTFIELNNDVLDRFFPGERQKIGVHTWRSRFDAQC